MTRDRQSHSQRLSADRSVREYRRLIAAEQKTNPRLLETARHWNGTRVDLFREQAKGDVYRII